MHTSRPEDSRCVLPTWASQEPYTGGAQERHHKCLSSPGVLPSVPDLGSLDLEVPTIAPGQEGAACVMPLSLKKRFGYLALTESQWEAMWFMEPGLLKQRWMAKARPGTGVSKVALGQWALLGGWRTGRTAIFNAAVSPFWREFTSKALILGPCSWGLYLSIEKTQSWLLTGGRIGFWQFLFSSNSWGLS